MVDLSGQNPCWEGAAWRVDVSEGNSSLSSTLTTGLRRDIGLYEVPWSVGFPSFRTGMINANFQIAGTTASLTDVVVIVVASRRTHGSGSGGGWGRGRSSGGRLRNAGRVTRNRAESTG
jgi:hypothetical protein